MSKAGSFPAPHGRFATTHWSLVLAAGSTSDTACADALAQLCEAYWHPVYAFVRRQGHSADEAGDLTQAFFARVLEKSYLRDADPRRGRFRSFLLGCLRHFLSNERDRTRRLKRGGGRTFLPLEMETAERRYLMEPRDEMTPERIFDRRWAVVLLDRTLARLRSEYTARNRDALFGRLAAVLTGDAGEVSYESIACELAMTPGAVKVAAHRLRRRFRELLLDEVAATVSDASDAEDEIRYLLNAVRS